MITVSRGQMDPNFPSSVYGETLITLIIYNFSKLILLYVHGMSVLVARLGKEQKTLSNQYIPQPQKRLSY